MSDDRVLPIGGKARRACPTCGKPSDERFRPFCSRRCKERDLYRWFAEDYRVKTDEAPPEASPGPAPDGDDEGR